MDGCLNLLQRVAQSTVTLGVDVSATHPSVPVLGSQRFGTGSVVDHDGHILTVNYIVIGADRVVVTDIDGNDHEGRVVAKDFFTGVAIVGVEPGVLTPLKAGSSHDLSPGDDTFVVASSGGSERRTGSGFVSSLDPFDAYWEYSLDRAIWLSCVNPGLGGAPVCDKHGRLTGVISLNLGNVGRTTLAVPAEHYFDHATELLAQGRRTSRPARAWLGMFCYAMPDRTVVAGLMPGGPGERGGLASGDVIVSINDEKVEGRHELYEQLWRHRPGEAVSIKVYRTNRIADLLITPEDAEEYLA